MTIKWKDCFKVALSAFVLFLCIHFFDKVYNLFSLLLVALVPVVAGCIVAYIVNILMSGYEKIVLKNPKRERIKKIKAPVCLALAYFTLFAIVMIVVMLVLPQFVNCIKLLISQMPDAMERFVGYLEGLGFVPEDILKSLSKINWREKIGDIIKAFTPYFENVFDAVVNTVSSVFSVTVSVFLAFIFSIYLLLSKKTLKIQTDKLMTRYFKQNVSCRIKYIINVFDDCFHKYIVGQCTEAVILGTLCTAGMLILRLPYAAMIGALVAVTAIIPIAGAYIGAFVGAFMIATVSPVKSLIFIIFLIVLQQIEGNLIYPKVVGSSLGLPGLFVLVAVTVGGGMFGITGMIVGVPITAAIYRFIKEDIKKHEKNKKPPLRTKNENIEQEENSNK